MKTFFGLSALMAFAAIAPAQNSAETPGTPVHTIVTVEVQKGNDVPELTQQDVMVYHGKDRLPVIDLTPLTGERAALQLMLLIDDDASPDLGVQFGDIKQFIGSLPSSTQIAIEYMRNGTAQVAQPFTNDHAAAVKKLRLPLGPFTGEASPYISLEDVIKRWPATEARREVLMISSGIDSYYSVGPENPYLQTAIEQALRHNVVVHSIYYGSSGHFGHSFARSNWGQNYLSILGDETGGEAYWQGFLNAVSFKPYLDDLSNRLNHQYMLSFLAKADQKTGILPIKLRTELKGVEVVSADRVWVANGR